MLLTRSEPEIVSLSMRYTRSSNVNERRLLSFRNLTDEIQATDQVGGSQIYLLLFLEMTREEKLEAIYDEIDRTIVFFNQFWGIEFDWEWDDYTFLPIVIGDLMEYFKNSRWYVDCIIGLRNDYANPLYLQSDECIDFVHSLIPKS